MIGLLSPVSLLVLGLIVARADRARRCVLYLTVKYTPVISRIFRGAAALSCRCESVRSSWAKRSSS